MIGCAVEFVYLQKLASFKDFLKNIFEDDKYFEIKNSMPDSILQFVYRIDFDFPDELDGEIPLPELEECFH